MRKKKRLLFLILVITLLIFSGCAISPSVKDLEDKVNTQGQEILAKDKCDATLDDVKKALEVAGEAQKLGLDQMADQLIAWSKDAFSAAVSKKAGKLSEKERLDLAAEAQKLGLDQLADDLINGREIISDCDKWKGILDVTMEGAKDSPVHLDFSFEEKEENKIEGSGTGTHRDKFADGEGCEQYVDNPAKVKISGEEKDNNFNMQFDLSLTVSKTACGVPASIAPGVASLPIVVTVSAKDGAKSSCSKDGMTCSVEIHKQ